MNTYFGSSADDELTCLSVVDFEDSRLFRDREVCQRGRRIGCPRVRW